MERHEVKQQQRCQSEYLVVQEHLDNSSSV
jgi:hypothetical protein